MARGRGGRGGRPGGRGGGGPSNKLHKSKEESGAVAQHAQLSPHECVEAVRPFWQSLSPQERAALLEIDVGTLRQRAQSMCRALRQEERERLRALEGNADDMAAAVAVQSMEVVLDEGLQRLRMRGTWKLWLWSEGEGIPKGCGAARTFRAFLEAELLQPELCDYLPPWEDVKAPEKPAEEALRIRMAALQQVLHARTHQGEPSGSGKGAAAGAGARAAAGARSVARGRSRPGAGGSGGGRPAAGDKGCDFNIEALGAVLEALGAEHECLYQWLVEPIAVNLTRLLEKDRDTTLGDSQSQLYNHLHQVPYEFMSQVVGWLLEKLSLLSMKLKAGKELCMGVGDVDMWFTVDDGRTLAVKPEWLRHLQGHVPHGDCHPLMAGPEADRVLEWVYGTFAPFSQHARDVAQRPLGSHVPSAADAHRWLVSALEDSYVWGARMRQARALMYEILTCRMEVQQLAHQHSVRAPPAEKVATAAVAAESAAAVASESAAAEAVESVAEAPAGDANAREQGAVGGTGTGTIGEGGAVGGGMLPDDVIIAMLRREALLTRAKLHVLVYEHIQQDRIVHLLKARLQQGEPVFERLKRQVDELNKHTLLQGMDAAYRSAAETERHRAQLASAAIDEHLKVHTAFREQGARLKDIYDKKQRCECAMSKRENEIKQLHGWRATVENLVDKFEMAAAGGNGGDGADGSAVVAGASAAGQVAAQLSTSGQPQPQACPTASQASEQPEATEEAGESSSGAAVRVGAWDEVNVASPRQGTREPVAAGDRQREGLGGTEEWGQDGGNGAVGQEASREGRDSDERADASGRAPQQQQQQQQQEGAKRSLARLRVHFHRDILKQLYDNATDKELYERLQQEVEAIDKRLEEAEVVVQHLELNLCNVACDDPGATISAQLALPILQERLDAKAREYAAERARQAEEDLIRMEASGTGSKAAAPAAAALVAPPACEGHGRAPDGPAALALAAEAEADRARQAAKAAKKERKKAARASKSAACASGEGTVVGAEEDGEFPELPARRGPDRGEGGRGEVREGPPLPSRAGQPVAACTPESGAAPSSPEPAAEQPTAEAASSSPLPRGCASEPAAAPGAPAPLPPPPAPFPAEWHRSPQPDLTHCLLPPVLRAVAAAAAQRVAVNSAAAVGPRLAAAPAPQGGGHGRVASAAAAAAAAAVATATSTSPAAASPLLEQAAARQMPETAPSQLPVPSSAPHLTALFASKREKAQGSKAAAVAVAAAAAPMTAGVPVSEQGGAASAPQLVPSLLPQQQGGMLQQQPQRQQEQWRRQQQQQQQQDSTQHQNVVPPPRLPLLPPQQQQQQEPVAQQQQPQPARRPRRADDHECVICMDEERDVVLLPCGHLALCRRCAQSVQADTNQCPICRSSIETVIPIRRA